MYKNILLVLSLISLLNAQTASEFKKEQLSSLNKQKKAFKNFKDKELNSFENYKLAQKKAFQDYKNDLEKIWNKPKLSTKKQWVSYSKNMKTMTNVDFENEVIEIQTIASTPKEAKQKMEVALARAVVIDTKTAQESDELEKRLQKIPKPKNIVDDKVKAEPILSTVIFDKKPTKKSVKSYVNKNIVYDRIKVKPSAKLNHENIYSVKVKMPKDTMIKRADIYYKEVKKQANLQNLPIALVFAIMHSESNFNPRARSHVPAYGLMQIVPKTAGIDSYVYLYKKKKIVSSTYLYNSTNNIKMGSAYLHILYYNYLRKIKNPDSKLYCTIAAYNTGAGNIAWAFTKTNNVNRAAPIINTMTPDEVYNKLLNDLKYDEPKKYLKKVIKRMAAYHKLYPE